MLLAAYKSEGLSRFQPMMSGSNTCAAQATKRTCDLLIYSGGWSPAVHLHSQSGGINKWDDNRHCFVPHTTKQASFSIGSCNGTWSLEDCLKEGIACGRDVAGKFKFKNVNDINITNYERKLN